LSVAIAPLKAANDNADALRFAEALTRDLMTGLSLKRQYGQVRVVVIDPTAAHANRVVDARQLGHRLNVRYVLEGDVRGGGAGYSVSLRLVDVVTGGQVWSERGTLQNSDVLAESSSRLRNQVERLRTALVNAETQHALTQPLSRLSATELVLRATGVWERDPSLAGTIEARALVDKALRLEPNLVPALISRAVFANYQGDVDPNQDRDRIGREQDEFTARAIKLDPSNPDAWKWRGIALEYLGRWDASLDANGMAIKLEPDNPWFYLTRGWTMSMMGRPAEALALVDRALAMDPTQVGLGWAMRVGCEAHLLAGQVKQAIATCEKAAGLDNDWMNNLFLAAAYANHGDLAKAAMAKAEALRTVPGYTIAQLRAKRYSDHPEYQRLAEIYWYDGLRKAGIPEK
jgi:TolB-like protein